MLKKAASITAGLLLLTACGESGESARAGATPTIQETVTSHASYPEYASLSDLVKASTTVVRGNIVATRVELIKPAPVVDTDSKKDPQAGLPPSAQDDTPGSPGTIATLEVTESLSGGLSVGDRIEVTQPGGVYEGVDYRVEGQTLYAVGQPESLYFLEYVEEFGLYTPVNADQSTYAVQPDGGLVSDQSEDPLSITSIDEVQEAIASS